MIEKEKECKDVGKGRRFCSRSRVAGRRRREEGGYEVWRAGLSDMGPRVCCCTYVPDWSKGSVDDGG